MVTSTITRRTRPNTVRIAPLSTSMTRHHPYRSHAEHDTSLTSSHSFLVEHVSAPPEQAPLPTQPSIKDNLPRPPLRYWAWLKFWTFTGQHALLWWVGALFLIGAFLFTFVGITEVCLGS